MVWVLGTGETHHNRSCRIHCDDPEPSTSQDSCLVTKTEDRSASQAAGQTNSTTLQLQVCCFLSLTSYCGVETWNCMHTYAYKLTHFFWYCVEWNVLVFGVLLWSRERLGIRHAHVALNVSTSLVVVLNIQSLPSLPYQGLPLTLMSYFCKMHEWLELCWQAMILFSEPSRLQAA
jgi:hypothetical protein